MDTEQGRSHRLMSVTDPAARTASVLVLISHFMEVQTLKYWSVQSSVPSSVANGASVTPTLTVRLIREGEKGYGGGERGRSCTHIATDTVATRMTSAFRRAATRAILTFH